MEDVIFAVVIVAVVITVLAVSEKVKRRWGENPSDATYGGKR